VVVAVSFEVLTVGDRKGKGRENQIILRAAFSSRDHVCPGLSYSTGIKQNAIKLHLLELEVR
jgi:hypothetical protein